MKKFNLVIFLFKLILFNLLILSTRTEENDQMKTIGKLRSKLLDKYDRLSKPVKNYKNRIELVMMIHLFQIVDLSSDGILKTNLLMLFSWDDAYLTWNTSEYNKIDTIRFGPYEIWKPDVIIWNYDKGNAFDAFEDNDLLVDFNGSVSWDSLVHSQTYCSLQLDEYPFDVQKCSIKIGPWMYNSKDINLTSDRTIDGPFYSNGEWEVIKKDAIVVGNKPGSIFTYVNLKLTLQRRTNIYTYFIVLPYLLSVFFLLTTLIVQLDIHQRHLFTGCSIFIQLSLIMFIISHIGFWSAKAPRSVRCMSINILFAICSICLTTLLTIKNDNMKSRKLPLFIDTLLDNQIIGRIFIMNLDTQNKDLMPFINEEEQNQTNDNLSIEILNENDQQQNQQQSTINRQSNILVLEKELNDGELFNLKRWNLFRTLIDRLELYIYLIILVTFHI